MKDIFNPLVIKYLIIIGTSLFIAGIISKALRVVMTRFFMRSADKLKIDHTRFNFLKNAVSFIVFMGAISYIFSRIPELKAVSVTLFAGAGILAAIVGFASQEAFSNIVNGLFLVIFQPIRVGDNIKVGDLHSGIVEDITLRHTIIRNFENRRIIIPNSVMGTQTIINSTIEDETICNWIEIGITYDSDIDKAIDLIQKLAEAHPNFLDKRSIEEKAEGKPAIQVKVIALADSAVTLRAWVWTSDAGKGTELKFDLYEQIKKTFDKEKVAFPFPTRTIYIQPNK
jgi:small-conductance mechanosensitive channel